MPIVRATLVSIQALCYWLASTPPNRTPEKARFDGGHPLAARMATGIFRIQAFLVVICAISEVLLTAVENTSIASAFYIQSAICPWIPTNAIITQDPRSSPFLRTTPLVMLGVLFVVSGTLLRLHCFRTLGKLFTFDLTIMPSHKLVTRGPYSYVRHPSYSGSLLVFFGIGLVNLTEGGWVVECGILGHGALGMGIRMAAFCALMIGWLALGIFRSRAEDAELRKHFGEEWIQYAGKIRWWFVPGIL